MSGTSSSRGASSSSSAARPPSGKKSPVPPDTSRRAAPHGGVTAPTAASAARKALVVRTPSPRPATPPSPRLYSTSPVPPPSLTAASELSAALPSAAVDLEALCNSAFAAYAAQDAEAFQEQLSAIRSAILFHGIPLSPSPSPSPSPTPEAAASSGTSLRGRLWQLLLGLGSVSSSSYIALIRRGRSDKYSKIRGDSFRTFPQDRQFTAAVREEQIVRCLNAFVHAHASATAGAAGARYAFSYVQGMNTIAAPLLYCMGELSAYHAFQHFVTRMTPLYWVSSHIGAQAGCKLVDRCLASIDPELSAHLTSRQLSSYLYAFHCVSSFSASVPPFSQLVVLWDFLLAFGPHLNILIVAAQIISLRNALLASDQPKAILDYRKWPPLRARVVIAMCLSFVSYLDSQLYDDVRMHAWDEKTAERITGRQVEVAHKD